MGRLDGKVGIVTGGARGSGEQIARAFVSEGMKVVLVDILEDRGKVVADELGDAAFFVRCDVTNEQDWQNAVAAAVREFGRLDVLVNNAAVLHLSLIEHTDADDYLRVLR